MRKKQEELKVMRRKWIYILVLLISMSFSTFAYAASESTITASYRVKPLQEKLAAMTQKDIDQSIGKFSDVGKHWAASSIGKLTSLGVLSGCGDGTFKPENKVSIDEFICMAVRSLGFKPESGSSYWAQPYIDIAIDLKLIDKAEFESYKKSIRREQAVRIAVKALMLYETAPNSSIYNYIRGKIKDYPSVGDNYKQYVLQAYATGIIVGNTQGYFNSGNSLSRAEAATIFIKNLDAGLRSPMKPDESEVLAITDSWGTTYEIYPTDRPELFQTAVVLNNSTSKTSGYGVMDYNPYDQIVSASFYESKKAMEESDFNVQMGFSIYPMGEESHPYNITVFVPDRVKELHMGFVSAVFKHLFGKDSEKAVSQFTQYIDLSAKTEIRVEDNPTFNGRKVRFYKVSGENAFTVWIYDKK
jgi:hypothetical protein